MDGQFTTSVLIRAYLTTNRSNLRAAQRLYRLQDAIRIPDNSDEKQVGVDNHETHERHEKIPEELMTADSNFAQSTLGFAFISVHSRLFSFVFFVCFVDN